MQKPKKAPLIVTVKDGQYITEGEPTYLNILKAKVLDAKGGINESVADGVYTFNIVWRRFHFYTQLYPA
jgi:hypothetical protein